MYGTDGLEMQGDLLVADLDAETPPDRRTLPGDLSFALGISPDGALLTIARMETARITSITELYTTSPWAQLGRLGRPGLRFRTFAFSADGAQLAAGGWLRISAQSNGGAIEIYKLLDALPR